MRAGRCSKTVAFVATLALTTFGALATASAPTHPLPPAFRTPRGLLGPNLVDRSLKTAFAPAAGTSRSVKGDMAQPVGVGALATAQPAAAPPIAARKEGEPEVSLGNADGPIPLVQTWAVAQQQAFPTAETQQSVHRMSPVLADIVEKVFLHW